MSNLSIKGIDISNWQGNVDFNKVKNAGYEIAYIKATEGQHTLDKNFNTNYANAKASGINIGFYHFLHGNENGKAQAEWMYSNIKDKEFQCKIAIDIEVTDGANTNTLSQIVCDFSETIKELTGKGIVVYTYTSFLGSNLNSSIDKYPLWIAEYGVSQPRISRNYIGWQYADNGQVDGCPNGNTDLDSFSEEIYCSAPIKSKPIKQINSPYHIGEEVKITGNIYATGQTIPGWVKVPSYPIIQVTDDKVLLGNGLNSWVNNDGITPVSNFYIGEQVKIIGSKYATGEPVPNWVKENFYTIEQLTDNKALLKEIESWVHLNDLIKNNIVVGAKVRIKPSATTYATGEPIPNWVKGSSYTVEQITEKKVLLKEILSWIYISDLQI